MGFPFTACPFARHIITFEVIQLTTTTAKISGDAIYTQCFMKNPHVHIIHCSDSEILVKHGTRSRFSNVIKDEGRTKLLGKVLRAVSDPISLKALYEQEVVEERELDDARDLIEYLLKENVLISPDDYLPHVYLSMQFGKQIPTADGKKNRIDRERFHRIPSCQRTREHAGERIVGAG